VQEGDVNQSLKQRGSAESERGSLSVVKVVKGYELARDVVKGFVYLGCAYFGYLAIVALAGQQTDARFALSYFTSGDNDYGLPWLVALVVIVLAFGERKLRLRKTRYLQGRIRELEQRVDPNRTSSGLLEDGSSNPKDDLK
jgi:hypothetical protein